MAKKIRVWDGSVWQDVATGMASGVSTAGGSTVTASATSIIPLILKGASGQTSDLLQIQNSSDTVLFEVDSGGNLGVGTTALTTASGYASITLNGTTGSLWSAKVAGTETFRIQPTSTVTTINGIANIPVIFNTNNAERVRITASGDVGIGGIVPAYKLDVSSTARVGGTTSNAGTGLLVNGAAYLATTTNWNFAGLGLIRNAANTSTPRFIEMALDGDALTATTIGATNSIWGIYDSAPTTGSLSSTLNAVMGYGAYAGHRWYNNGSEKMRIDSVGSVIIGSTVGGSQKRGLSITSGNSSGLAGGIYMISATSSGGDGATIEAIGQRSDGNGSRTFSGTVALGHLRTDAASANGQVLGSIVFGGNPSGTAASNVIYSASIYGVADGTWSSTSAMPTALSFYTGSTGTILNAANADTGVERMRINSAGNVGIGTSTPAAKLDVVGTFESSLGAVIYGQNSANISLNNGLVLGTVDKATAPSGGQGGILITSNDATNQMQGTIQLVTDATAGNRRLSIGAIEQNVSYRNVTLAEGGGNVGVGLASPSSKLTVGANPPAAGALAAVGSNGGISLALSDNINNSLYVRHAAGGGAIIGTDGGGAIRLAAGGNTAAEIRMIVGSDGIVTIPSGRIYINSSSSVTGANWGEAMLHITGVNAADSHPGMAWHAPGSSAISLFHTRGTQAIQIMGNGGIVDTTSGRMTIRNIAVSTSAPSGGVDGDMWAVYV